MTPSPTGASMFSAARYQLFGGPAPVQEATYSAMGPGVGQHAGAPGAIGGGLLATSGPAAHGLAPGRQPLSYGASTFSGFAPAIGAAPPPAPGQAPRDPPGASAPVPPPPLNAAPAPPAALAVAPALPPAPPAVTAQPLSRVEQGDEEDEDDDSDGEGQQQQAGRSPEDAPKPPPGALHPSIGSENHAEGTCKRCCFFPRNRCNNGYDCDFCHYEHEKRKRKNKKSKKKNKDSSGDQAAAQSGTAPAAVGCETAPGTSAGTAPAGSPSDVWSTSFGGGVAQARTAEPWQSAPPDPYTQQQPPVLPPVVYENTDGAPQWSYQWIDDPRPFPGQFPETPANYFAPATGLQGAGTQPLAGDPAIAAAGLQPVQPLYSQPLPFTGTETAAAPWAAPWQPPFPAPAYPAIPAESLEQSPPQAAELASPPPSTVAAAASAAQGGAAAVAAAAATQSFSPPPMEAPKLPEDVQKLSDMSPPPMSAPTLPPVVDSSQEESDDHPPPPVSSPKLPNNVLMSLQQEPPPVPGGPPI